MKNFIKDSIIDRFGNIIGDVTIDEEGAFYYGSFSPKSLSSSLKDLFDEYEYSVNNQILSKLDDIQAAILAHGLAMKSNLKPIKEIQLFGSEITLWF
jgi:hypothetical protein